MENEDNETLDESSGHDFPVEAHSSLWPTTSILL